METQSLMIIGHRGLPALFPENTLVSFEQAIEAGVNAIEFDIHPTRDNQLVVTHDDTVDRCSNGHGPVHDFTFEEIRCLDFGAWKGPEFAGTRIPTLDEVLDTIFSRRPGMYLLLELKENNAWCAEKVLETIRRRNMVGNCLVLSFHTAMLELMREQEPGLCLQGFPHEYLCPPEPYSYDLINKVCFWAKDLDAEKIDFFRRRNITIDIYPVDDAVALDRVLTFDVDSLTTNAANVLIPLLRERGLRPPETVPAWRLHGAGLDSLRLDRIPVAPCGDEELLVRIDAIGLCFSDVKLIRAGESHPKIRRGLAENPLIPGHEAVMTVVRRGRRVPAEFAPRSRWVIQCDIFIKGESCAFGYGMDGGFARFARLDRRVWEGETRSWLLPCPQGLSNAAAALIEPWTCVNAAYRIEHRAAPRQGGRVLIVAEPGDRTPWKAGELLRKAEPRSVAAVGLSAETAARLAEELGRPVEPFAGVPEGMEFDDIFCCGVRNRAIGEAAVSRGARSAIINFLGEPPDEAWKLDIGALHYRNLYYQTDSGNDLSAPYARPRRTALKPGGIAWFAGGAGAMGQMHVQLALESAAGPARILVTDLDAARIAHVEERLRPLAEKRGVELRFLNPAGTAKTEFDRELAAFAPDGFDDIVILVPSAAVAEQGIARMAAGALLNVFAGIPAGESAAVPLRAVLGRSGRFTGSSGSSLDDMADTLALAASGALRPERALAAVAGMNAVKAGLEAVAAGRFPGKTVVYPDCPDLPLTPLAGLAQIDSEAAAALDAEGCWTGEAERILRKKWSRA